MAFPYNETASSIVVATVVDKFYCAIYSQLHLKHAQLTCLLNAEQAMQFYLSANKAFNGVRQHDHTCKEDTSSIGHSIVGTIIVQKVTYVYRKQIG